MNGARSVRASVSAVVGVCSAVGLAGVARAEVSFYSLGTSARVRALSGDGLTAVGDGFVWRSGSGLGVSPIERANGVSYDGSVIVGRTGSRAKRWTSAGVDDLNTFDDGSVSTANGVSADGQIIVGNAFNGDFGDPQTVAYCWKHGFGSRDIGETLTSGSYEGYGALGANADGSVIVGNRGYVAFQAFRWTDAGCVNILPDSSRSSAHAVSSDGSVVAGAAGFESVFGPMLAFRWENGSPTILGALPGGDHSAALGMSGDGSVLVGVSGTGGADQAFLWTQSDGMRRVHDVLSALGETDHLGWSLDGAVAVSADGLTFVGYGLNPSGAPESWIATIPAPGALPLVAVAALVSARRRR